jgi:hypothetical protein
MKIKQVKELSGGGGGCMEQNLGCKKNKVEVIKILKLTCECFLLADLEGIFVWLKTSVFQFSEANPIFPLRK